MSLDNRDTERGRPLLSFSLSPFLRHSFVKRLHIISALSVLIRFFVFQIENVSRPRPRPRPRRRCRRHRRRCDRGLRSWSWSSWSSTTRLANQRDARNDDEERSRRGGGGHGSEKENEKQKNPRGSDVTKREREEREREREETGRDGDAIGRRFELGARIYKRVSMRLRNAADPIPAMSYN